MKKIAAILLVAILAVLMVSCGGGEAPAPEPNPSPKPLLRGDSAVIFGQSTAFTLVYPAGDVSVSGALASDIIGIVTSAGLKSPAFSADKDKEETKCELLIGETDRALSAEAKTALAENIAADPNGDHWIWIYKDGQLAV